MANFLENVIEKMIGEGLITESELKQRIEEERAKSPVNDLNNLAFVESMQMQNINDLFGVVSMLMMRITELEGEINELHG